jgi:hypothetical protein
VERKSPATVAVKTQNGAKKRKAESQTVTADNEEGPISGSSGSSSSKQMSVVVLKLDLIAKALATLNGHLGVIARAVSGEASRGKAAAAVGASYSRAKLGNQRARESDEDDSDGEGDGDKENKSGRSAAPASLAAEVAQNTRDKASAKGPKGKDAAEKEGKGAKDGAEAKDGGGKKAAGNINNNKGRRNKELKDDDE